MDSIKTLIVDDEELARLRLRRLLEQETDIEIIGECSDGDEAIEFIRLQNPQLVFLDIQMKRVGGLEVVDQLRTETPPVFVFVTAYDQYAVRAFEANALDYLLKPFSEERFNSALEKSRERIRSQKISTYTDQLLSLLQHTNLKTGTQETMQAPRTGADYPERLVLKTGSRLVFLDASEVDWVEAEGVYVRLHVGTKSHLLRESLSNVEERLDPRKFVRIHRSTLVNVSRIKEIVPHLNGGSVVILTDGRRLKMSRSYRDRVNATLG